MATDKDERLASFYDIKIPNARFPEGTGPEDVEKLKQVLEREIPKWEMVISLDRDGRFLEALLQQKGEDWLVRRLSAAFTEFGDRAARNEVSPDFLAQYRATLEAAPATLPNSASRTGLRAVIERVAAGIDAGR